MCPLISRHIHGSAQGTTELLRKRAELSPKHAELHKGWLYSYRQGAHAVKLRESIPAAGLHVHLFDENDGSGHSDDRAEVRVSIAIHRRTSLTWRTD